MKSRKPEIKAKEGYVAPSAIVSFGGHDVTIYKMSMGSFLRAVKQAEPQVKDFLQQLVQSEGFGQAMDGKKVDQKKAAAEIKEIFEDKLGEMMLEIPEVVFRILACVMNLDPDDMEDETVQLFWESMEPLEFGPLVEKLDELNDFSNLIERLIESWKGIAKRYGLSL